MMKKGKLLSLLLAGAMAAALFAGCGGGDKGGNGDGGDPDDTGNITGSNPGDNEGGGGGGQTTIDTSAKFNGKIYVVGDSTVCNFGSTDDALYIPRYGYGTQISSYINVLSANVKNLALSGRSSYSFTKESNYYTFTGGINSDDYLFIGFGHNDEKYEVDRYADPTLASDDKTEMIGTYDANREVSFKYILKHYYIDIAKAAGATPVLCTPIVRLNKDSSKYDTDHITSDKTNYKDSTSGVTTDWKGGNYAQAIRELAEEEGLTCIDLTTTTKNDYKAIGYDEAVKYHSIKAGKWTDDSKTAIEPDLGSADNTHTNLYGAKMNAYHIANAIKSSNLSLASSVKTNNTKPVYSDYATDMVNSDYEVPSNEPFKPEDASSKWSAVNGTELADSNSETVYKWYGTAFGASLGTSNIASSSAFSIAKGSDADGVTFTINADSGKGKIQKDDDSLVAVFIQIPFETAFTVSATATLNTFTNTNNQTGFGMMIRDDITVDQAVTMKGNYVNAGCIVSNSGADRNVYAGRLNGTQFFSGTKQDFNTATQYSLTIARTSQSIMATVGDNAAYSAVKDFDLGASDSKYVYLCLWATRGTNVTFSNITFASSEWVQA